jgi:hypothetical protein
VVGIGFGVTWLGYSICLYGYCLAKQYDVHFLNLVAPTGSMAWPPPPQADTVNSQTPQPTVAAQYLAPLTTIAGALASLVGGASSLVGGAVGAAGSVVDQAAGALGGILGIDQGPGKIAQDLPTPAPGSPARSTPAPTPSRSTPAVPRPTTSSGTGSGWGVQVQQPSGWTTTNLTGGWGVQTM